MTAPNKFTRSIAQRFQQITTLAFTATCLAALNPPTAALARPIVIKDGCKNSGVGKGNERRHCQVTRMSRNSLTEKSHRRTSLKATSLNDTE